MDIGQTEAMNMVEILNDEFDAVVNENDQLKKEIETLKEKLKVSESKKDKINEYYCNECGPPSCDQCQELIYYGQAHAVFSRLWDISQVYEVETYCMDCKSDIANLENGWTCQLFEEYD